MLLESFVLRFKNRKAYQQLQDCKTNKAITIHLLNLTTNRYNKWKNRCKTIQNKWGKWKTQTRNSEQLINNLNQQIFALQNNPPNIQRIGMAGYPPPNFNGYPDEDPEEFIDSFRSYLVAVGINVLAGHAHKV